MNDISSACDKLLIWINSAVLLYETNKIVKPLEDDVARLTKIKWIKEV